MLIAIGLSVGAEQFGSLIEYCGLLAIYAALGVAVTREESLVARDSLRFLRLCAVSLPVYLFLTSTPKPQLLPIGLNLFALALLMAAISRPNVRHEQIRRLFVLLSLLLIASASMKFSFMLSSALIGIFSLWAIGRKNLREGSICCGIGLLLAVALFFPLQWWKHVQYGGQLVSTMLSPIVGDIPGDDLFLTTLRTYTDGDGRFFPLNIILPLSANTLSMVLGVAPAIFFFYRRNLLDKRFRPYVLLILAQVLITGLLGQRTGRFFIEPLLWLLIFLVRFPIPVSPSFRGFRLAITLQSLSVLTAGIYGALLLFPGSLQSDARRQIMERYADGYVLADWIDKRLPRDAVLLSSHRALAVMPRRTLSLDWLSYLPAFDLPESRHRRQADLLYYSQSIQASGANYVLLVSGAYQRELADCLGEPLAQEARLYRETGRNPLVQRDGFQPVALYPLIVANLPACIQSPPAIK